LLFAAVNDERGPDHHDAHAADVGHARLSELLVEDELVHDAEAGAAVLLRPRRGDPPALTQLLAPLLNPALPARGLVVRVVGIRDWRRLVREELAYFLAPRRLLGGISKVHTT